MAFLISIVFVLNIGLVYSLEPNEASVSMFWSAQTVYQGEVTSVRITFTSNYAEPLTIVGLGLQFDWEPDVFYGPDFSDNPVTVQSYGTHIFDPISIQIPQHVAPGKHSYFVGVDGTLGYSLTSFSWDSPTFTIEVGYASGKVYNVLATQFEIDLNDARSANFASEQAKSLLQHAQDEYNLSRSLVSGSIVTEENWSEALSHIYNAIDFLEQAFAAEQTNGGQTGDAQELLLYLAIAIIAIVVALSIVIVVMRKRRKQPEPEMDQPVDQSLETQDFMPE